MHQYSAPRKFPRCAILILYNLCSQLPFFLDILPFIAYFSLSNLIILSTVTIEYPILLERSSRVILLFSFIDASMVYSLSDKFNSLLISSVILSTFRSYLNGNSTFMLQGEMRNILFSYSFRILLIAEPRYSTSRHPKPCA